MNCPESSWMLTSFQIMTLRIFHFHSGSFGALLENSKVPLGQATLQNSADYNVDLEEKHLCFLAQPR